ncbi:bifunctional folylpolyglutamate synthase/dihydrofolate synthase [Streptomyces sp. WAC05374]|uniref:bifunctional tetrahydrofolate synthase/dihydrofolate synthase n=1 Tax=Streptomyces sp. WAC05374 TaxID=2487420 RepID=UPI000F890597|nr:folylpolyglutamate synthase/dihydrofolate synthase family protein [Streptomyces sp. WAC05374]RST16711.1 bifunctional folylpolyglutamate synthase/dihydrofolate synthase [Streptomyces sp. WAC05374]TDF45375.1 bifunctional folylpolyglutamate synthase/dihydrofolate synthase [Streptomyces sp. WAC05374]TDF55637.1 bifunctional folylpolyglutamate synthase/dihydrofolate synthase [Streptomyces sp. WAC05374]TDF58775.1 bifunctional folylpolyglutamate synthase/dihydrofolate synthase [Streptomyces sp. WAC0
MSEQPPSSDSDDFDEIVEAETERDPDLAVIEAGSRTLRAQAGPPPAAEAVPARPADPEVDKALREVEQELATRWGETKLEPSVARIAALMDVLGEPQRAYPSIHITGTNGKTSTARMIEALLGAFDLRTGRYTSPHVQSITERISLDGAPISHERFIETYQDIKPYVEMVDASQEYRLSFFEVLTGMAYAAFADAPVDVAVVEVGMGGSWDATNVIDGDVAVVTPIDLDHTDRLGATPAAIAGEKSGIIKQGATVILAQQPVDAAQVMLKKAVGVDATVAREGMEFGVVSREVAVGGQLLTLRGLGGEYEEIFLPLYGAHQAHNAAVALAAVEAFFGVGAQEARTLDVERIRQAFASVVSPGRLEVVRRSPTVVLDAAHNPAGARATAEGISEAFGFSRLVGVVATSGDKDVRGLLEAFEPIFAEIVVTQNSTHRAMDADELAAIAVEVFGDERVVVEPRLPDALEAAITLAEEEAEFAGAGVLVTGSVMTVGEARLLLGKG